MNFATKTRSHEVKKSCFSGVLEYWNIGKLLSNYHSITPLLHYSIILFLSFVSFRVFRGQFCRRLSSYLFCVILIIGNTPVYLPAQQLQSETPSSPEAVQYDKQQRNDTASLLYLGLIFLGLLLFGAMRGYKHAQKAGQISQDVPGQLQHERQQLLQYIANLDDQYAQGMLQEHAYSSERNRLKQRLVELTIQCKIISYSNPK